LKRKEVWFPVAKFRYILCAPLGFELFYIDKEFLSIPSPSKEVIVVEIALMEQWRKVGDRYICVTSTNQAVLLWLCRVAFMKVN
jgi:hypothetical protein